MTPPPCAVTSSSGPARPVHEIGEIRRRDHAKIAEFAAGNDLARAPVRRIKAVAVANDQMNAGPFHGIDHGAAFCERHRQGLLDQHMLAGGRRHANVGGVELMRGRHIDRFDLVRRHKVLPPTHRRARLEICRKSFACFGARVGCRDQRDALVLFKGRQHDGERAAESGHTEAQLSCGSGRTHQRSISSTALRARETQIMIWS